jgi:putative ABC transport system permease protein
MIRLALQSLSHFRSLLFPVVIGVAIAATVIVGALIVGDSVRGSLRFMAMDRIGKIDTVLIAPRWFKESIIDRSQLNEAICFGTTVATSFRCEQNKSLMQTHRCTAPTR